MMNYEFKAAFEIYAAKAPVNIPGAQSTAFQAYRIIQSALTSEERNQLQIDLGHALSCGEGRAAFDDTISKIRCRLKLL